MRMECDNHAFFQFNGAIREKARIFTNIHSHAVPTPDARLTSTLLHLLYHGSNHFPDFFPGHQV